MRVFSATLFTVSGLLTVTSAAAIQARQECFAYPWFLIPFQDGDCSGNPAAYQPNPGPISTTPRNAYCQPLYNPNTAPQGFGSVHAITDACPTQKWEFHFYVDSGCTSAPVVITSDQCVVAPSQVAGGRFEKFDAVLVTA